MKKWILIAIVVLCGVLLAPSNYDKPSAIRFIVLCSLTMAMVVCSKEFRIGTVHFFAIGFLLCVLWSGLFAVNRSEWLYWVLRAVLAVTFFSVVEIDEKLLVKTMMLLGIVFACYFWYEFFTWSRIVGQYQFDGLNGLMKQHNYWAAAHFFVIPFCFYGVWKKLACVLVPVMVAHIILLHSRSAIAALVVTSCVVGIINKKTRWYLLAGVSAMLIYFSTTHLFNYDSLHYRFEQWVPTLKMIHQNPWGVGAGNWWIVFPKYAPAMDFPNAYSQVSFRFPHNDFLWVWAETGIFGIFCYLGMFGIALWSAIKRKAHYLIIGLVGYMTLAFFTACRERPFASLMMLVFIVLACERKDEIKCYKEVLIPLTLLLVVLGFQYRSMNWIRCMQKVKTPTLKILQTEGYSPFTTLTYTGMPITGGVRRRIIN